jgi:putative transposase
VKYAFIRDHRNEFRVVTMCRVLRVHRSGFYAWLHEPVSDRKREDDRILWKIRKAHKASDESYGSPRIFLDLREAGETCGLNRVARLMRHHGLHGAKLGKRPRRKYGKPSTVAPNRLEQNFVVKAPDRAWVTDITYLRTQEGWLYLAAVIDLFSRRVVGWSMKPSMSREVVLDALMMAVWQRRPKESVIVHSDQGSQFGSDDWVRFCKAHGLVPSMSRRGNCYDNAVAESFFSSLKGERVKNRIYRTREEARADVFDYIEFFYNSSRRHSFLGQVSPEEFERRNTPA